MNGWHPTLRIGPDPTSLPGSMSPNSREGPHLPMPLKTRGTLSCFPSKPRNSQAAGLDQVSHPPNIPCPSNKLQNSCRLGA